MRLVTYRHFRLSLTMNDISITAIVLLLLLIFFLEKLCACSIAYPRHNDVRYLAFIVTKQID